jgi:hypothetical protein
MIVSQTSPRELGSDLPVPVAVQSGVVERTDGVSCCQPGAGCQLPGKVTNLASNGSMIANCQGVTIERCRPRWASRKAALGFRWRTRDWPSGTSTSWYPRPGSTRRIGAGPGRRYGFEPSASPQVRAKLSLAGSKLAG